MRKSAPASVMGIFGPPALIALVSIVGLVSALLDDGAMDAVSWVGLAVPLLVVGWALRCRRG